MLLLFAASCLVPLLRKVRDDTHESKYVNDESFDHLFGKESIENTLSKDLDNKESEPNVKADNILKIQKQEENGGEIDEDVAGLEKADKAIKEDEHEKEDENEEEDEDNEEDKIEENERGAGKGEGSEHGMGSERSRKGEENAEESYDKNLKGKIDGEKLEVHNEEQKDKRTEKSEEAATKNLQDVKEKVAVKEEGEYSEEADENVGKGDGDKVEAKEEADEEGEQATVGGEEGKLKEEEEDERTEEDEDRDNIENVDGKGKHKSKIEVNVPDDFDSQYKTEKKNKGVESKEKESKHDTEEEVESKDDMVSKQEEDPLKFPNHLEEKTSIRIKLMENHTNDTIFHVNQSNKYPSHDDDRIAYQVMHQEAFDYF